VPFLASSLKLPETGVTTLDSVVHRGFDTQGGKI
jgi:hypothetical protein